MNGLSIKRAKIVPLVMHWLLNDGAILKHSIGGRGAVISTDIRSTEQLVPGFRRYLYSQFSRKCLLVLQVTGGAVVVVRTQSIRQFQVEFDRVKTAMLMDIELDSLDQERVVGILVRAAPSDTRVQVGSIRMGNGSSVLALGEKSESGPPRLFIVHVAAVISTTTAAAELFYDFGEDHWK